MFKDIHKKNLQNIALMTKEETELSQSLPDK